MIEVYSMDKILHIGLGRIRASVNSYWFQLASVKKR